MLLCSFLLASVGWVKAEDIGQIYVSADYSQGDSDGSSEKPYTTLADAITAMNSGGTIIISPSKTAYKLPTSITQSFIFKGNSEEEGVPIIDLGDDDHYTNSQTNLVELSFENLQLQRNNTPYRGFKHSHKETYIDCAISGVYWTYAPEVYFTDCTFKQETADQYMVWVYGMGQISFENCSFYGATGKAILIYNEGENEARVSVTDCKFFADKIEEGKTAIQMHTERGTHGSLTISKSTATNFAPSINGGLWNCLNNSTKTPTDAFAVTVDDVVVNGLQKAIEYAEDRATLQLAAKTFELSSQLVIKKPITLAGAGMDQTIIKAGSADWAYTEQTKNLLNLVSIESGETGKEVTLQNLTISNSKRSGLNAQTAMNTALNNVKLADNTGAGMIVHSPVTANGLITEGNGWGGVNVDKGKPLYTISLTVDANCVFNDIYPIYSDDATETSADYVTTPTSERWTNGVFKTIASLGPDEKGKFASIQKRVWSEDLIVEVNDKDNGINIYANGKPVTVSDGEDNTTAFSIGDENNGSSIALPTDWKLSLYGGAKNANVTSTNITMESGTIKNIFGGGLAAKGTTPANVEQSATIVLKEGATVTNILQGGGQYLSKVPKVNLTSTNANIAYLMLGGYDAGSTGNTIDTSLENSNNGVNTVNVNINGGEIEIMGCGGGQGYTRTGNSTVNVKGAKIGYLLGTYSNGRADNIKATFTTCAINKELALINRGWVTDADFTFNNCTYGESLYASLAATIGWANSDTPGNPKPTVDGTVKFTFTGDNTPDIHITRGLDLANVELTGAKAIITHFDDITNATNIKELKDGLNSFTIGSGKIWKFNNGLEMTSDVTLNNNGSLSVGGVCTVATNAQLTTIMNADVKDIALAAGSYDGFTVSKSDVTISGNKTATITGTVTVSGSGVTLKETKLAPASGKAVNVADNGSLTVSHNYWGSATPDFATLIGGEGEVSPYPYYNKDTMTEYDLVSQFIKVDVEREITEKIYPNCNLLVTSKGHAKLTQKNAKFYSVIIEEGGQLTPPENNFTATGKVSVWNFVFKPSLKADKWKALGTQFVSRLIDNETGSDATLAEAGEDTGIWFATLKDNQTPAIEVTQNVPSDNVGLWAATAEKSYAFKATDISLVDWPNPNFSVDNGAKLQMCVNPNTHSFTTTETIYVLDAEKNVFVRREGATLAPFESYVIADDNTKATLRSIGTTDPNATGNEFVVKEGYYLTTERGAIVVHTAEPMELYVVAVSGAVVYRGTVADGERIAVPTGFYAVNGQMVRVK